MNRLVLALLLFAFWHAPVWAADVPAAGKADARVRFVDYSSDDVIVVNVRRGVVTRIVLAPDEKIVLAATGFTADCSKPELEWCVRADVGANQIWLKPMDRATHNNLELKTDKRDYSFEFRVLPDEPTGRGKATASREALAREAMYRVVFRYPSKPAPSPAPELGPLLAAQSAASDEARAKERERELLIARLEDDKPVPRNWQYTMQVLSGAAEIAPSLVFDDGRFTYFQFPPNREVPTIFYVSPAGEEERINFHMQGDLAVVERQGRRFVLRLGDAVVGVWNEGYDSLGVPPTGGTAVQGVDRVVKPL